MVLPREPPIAAGGKAKVLSKWPAFALFLPVMSVEGAGVGGKLGRGMMGRWAAGALIRKPESRRRPMLAAARGQELEDRGGNDDDNDKDCDRQTLETLRRAVSRAV